MADQSAWPPSPAEPSRKEEREAAIQKLSVIYFALCRRQRREYLGFVIVEVALTALCFATRSIGSMAAPDLFFASFVVGLVLGLGYLLYAGWREVGIRKLRREIEQLRKRG